MLPKLEKLRYVAGAQEDFCPRPLKPFENETRNFLAALSSDLLADPSAKALPDVIAFAWWCRKANIERLAAAYDDGACRIGRGVAFHVTPSNMPVNFAFSWIFSLLAGNSNIVRLPSRDFPQIPLVLGHITRIFESDRHPNIRSMNVFVSYGREEEINRRLSAIADVRILWGGDRTIEAIRQVAPLHAHALDIGFADRYSLCALDSAAVLAIDSSALQRLAADFFNDAYIMDQNACSSPRLILWLGAEDETACAMRRFWNAVEAEVARRYTLAPVAAVDKLAQACCDAVDLHSATDLQRGGNGIYRVRLNSLDPSIADRRCGSGYFYEFRADDIAELAPFVSRRFQTLAYYGVSRDEMKSFLLNNRLMGIDRIVPIGEAMNIGLLWDGHDLIRILSRVCEIH